MNVITDFLEDSGTRSKAKGNIFACKEEWSEASPSNNFSLIEFLTCFALF